MDSETQNVNDRYFANKFSLSTDKKLHVSIKKSNGKKYFLDYQILLLVSVTLTGKLRKFVGICKDEKLNWQIQIDLVIDKISKSIGLLFKAGLYLNPLKI